MSGWPAIPATITIDLIFTTDVTQQREVDLAKFLSFSLIFILIFCSQVFADQIFLKNGDRLTGKIVKKDGDKIVISTEAAGDVTIAWAAVEKIASDAPLAVELADGELVKGVVAAEEGKITVVTETAGTISVEKESIATVRSAEEQVRFEAERERLRDPGLLELWNGSANVGFSLTSGNSDTRSLTASFQADRATSKDKISVYANAVQASNSDAGVSVTTAQAVYGGLRYDYNLNRKTFVFASGDFEYDRPQRLDLRSVLGGGFGYKAVRSDRVELDLFGGATYNRENFSTGLARNSAEALAGNELKFRFTEKINLEQRLKVYPKLSDPGAFRSLLDASLITDLNDWLSWQVTLGNRFNSAPVFGAEKNDLLFSTGLRIGFGKKKR